MTSEIVIRVTNAMAARSVKDGKFSTAEEIARAALEALIPTSNIMDRAGVLYLRENPSDASGCFEAMISAALKGNNSE